MGWRVVPLSSPIFSCWKWVLGWDWPCVHSVCVEGECPSWNSLQQQTFSRIRCLLRLKLRKVPMAGSTVCRLWEGQWWALSCGWTPWPCPMDLGHTKEQEPYPPLLTWIRSYFNKQPRKSAFSQLKQHKIRLFIAHTLATLQVAVTQHRIIPCWVSSFTFVLEPETVLKNRTGYSSRSSPDYVTVIRLIFLYLYLWIML